MSEGEQEVTVFNVMNHLLVPYHEVVPEAEAKKVLAKYNASPDQLPKILETDAAARAISAKPGDVVKIVRKSKTAGQAIAYRLCVESL